MWTGDEIPGETRRAYEWPNNAYLLEASRAGAAVDGDRPSGFRYDSYVESIMGPLCFDYGFGPFRWVCTSGDPQDLAETDHLAAEVLADHASRAPDEIRGATWVSLHNGGGVGWGEVTNGGFGLVLDGTDDADRRMESMLFWDVNNGIARRAWARNPGAKAAARAVMDRDQTIRVTLPSEADTDLVADALRHAFPKD